MDKLELLKKVRIFQGLSEDELKKFGAIAEEEKFPPEAVIIEEGTEGRALFIIKRGTVTVTKVDGEVETELVKLVAGEEFGEMSLVEDTVTSARVTAYNEVECLIIKRAQFAELLDNDVHLSNQVFRNFTRVLSERLRNTSSELVTWKPDIAF
jgi:CRP/FNR family cyclic AMP-dependent transcriptional regulator